MALQQQRVRTDPRISINKLGEYLSDNSARRRRKVLEQQKRPPDFITARYRDAQIAIVDFVVQGGTNDQIILDAIATLEAANPNSEWDQQRQLLCIEALENFLDSVGDTLDLGQNMVATAGDDDQPKLRVNGVDISVRPELILSGTDQSGNQIVGAIKLVFGKTSPLSEDAGRYIATTVHQFVEAYHTSAGQAAPVRFSYVIDVFEGAVYGAPRSFARRRQDIAAACDEIRLVWPAL